MTRACRMRGRPETDDGAVAMATTIMRTPWPVSVGRSLMAN